MSRKSGNPHIFTQLSANWVPAFARTTQTSLLWLFLGAWLVLGSIDLTLLSWDLEGPLSGQVLSYLGHLRLGFQPMGILSLYLPYFVAVYLVSRGRGHFAAIVVVSLLARLALLPGYPILETDPYRYLWDGRMMLGGQNPFEIAPEEVEVRLESGATEIPDSPHLANILEGVREDPLHHAILKRINNKNVPTVYLPTAQLCFAFADQWVLTFLPAEVSSPKVDWEREVQRAVCIWKGVLLLFEAGVLWLIASLLVRLGRSADWLVVYGWSPLVLKEYSNSGHFDPVVIFCFLLGIRFLLPRLKLASASGTLSTWRGEVAAGVAFGLGAACKLFPLLIVPLAWRRLRAWGIATAVVTTMFLFLPFAGIGGNLFRGLAAYSDRWEFNSSLAAFFEWTIASIQTWTHGMRHSLGEALPPRPPLFTFAGADFDLDAFLGAKAICACLIVGTLCYLVWKSRKDFSEEGLLQNCFLMLGVLLLASPVTDPWYVGWIIPLLCFFPNRAWLFLTFSQQIYYLYFWNNSEYVKFSDLPWLGIPWKVEVLRPLEYVPFYALLTWDWWRNRNHIGAPEQV